MRNRVGLCGFAAVLALTGAGTARGEAPTYHREVVRILQENCQDCHRPGQVAPFPLLTYEQARKRADDLADVTESRKMPPWHVSTKEGGPFRDARVLRESDIATLAAWVEAGCPEGDPADAPAPRRWESDWTLGTPDLILKMPQPYSLSGDGRDEHRVYVIPTGLTDGRWVSAIDVKAGNPKVVHHILVAFDTRKAAQKMDEADPDPGYKVFGGFGIIPTGNLGGWSPGKLPRPSPEGVGRYLPAGADVLLQVHYHKSGKPETDASMVGIYFAKGPIDKMARGAMTLPPRLGFFQRPQLLIPAGDPNYEVNGSTTIEQDSHLITITPHMHWLGRDFVLTATPPGGKPFTLIRVDDWDFNWQGGYDFVTPVALAAGTRIDMKAHFDNSAKNPSNPNSPPKDVHWGEQTTDEMCIGFMQMTFDDEHRKNKPPARLLPKAD